MYILYILHTSVDLDFTLKKYRSRRYPTTYFTDNDYADDIALFASNTKDTEHLLHLLENDDACIGEYINEKKTVCHPEHKW